MIHHILDLPVAATLTYEILDPQHEQGRFVVTPAPGGIPDSGAVYFIVDDKGRLQKIGKTDDAEGLGGRLNAYKVKSGGKDATPNLYYRMMTGPLQGRSFKVYYRPFEFTQIGEVFGQQVEIRYTAHHFIESDVRERVRELRRDNMDTYPLWLEKGMYPSRTKKPKRARSKANRA